MFQRVIRCPISFFDMNPIGIFEFIIKIFRKYFFLLFKGRILNRFTRDVAHMDTDLAQNIPDLFGVNFLVISIIDI